MNQSKQKPKNFLKNLIFCLIFSFFSLIGVFFLLSYLLYRIPDFENYYAAFPIVLLFLEGVLIALFCRRFSENSPLFTLLSSALISFLSIILGMILSPKWSFSPRLLAVHFLFIFGTVLLQIIFKRKQPTKKKNKFPFTK